MKAFHPPFTMATSVSPHFPEQLLLIYPRKKTIRRQQKWPHRCGWSCYAYGILVEEQTCQAESLSALQPPAFSLLLGCSCSLLKQLLAALLLSSRGFYCATASWKATQLIECQMWCRPVSWALKLRGRAWIRGKVLRSDHRKSAPAGTRMRNKFAQQKLIYLSSLFLFFFKKRNNSLLRHF